MGGHAKCLRALLVAGGAAGTQTPWGTALSYVEGPFVLISESSLAVAARAASKPAGDAEVSILMHFMMSKPHFLYINQGDLGNQCRK